MTIQVPSIILPRVWVLGTETETIADVEEHTSIEFPVEFLQEKTVHITATEVARVVGVIAGGPFTLGEPVIGVPSGAVGIVFDQGANWIGITGVVGVFVVGDTITGTVSGANIDGGLAFAVPGPLRCWVELSPYPSANSPYWPEYYPITAAYWAAIGGGGGFLPPLVFHAEVSLLAGAPGTLVHTFMQVWNDHSTWARVVLQTPAIAANAYWIVQCLFSGKS